MINTLTGIVTHIQENQVSFQVGPVGLSLTVPRSTVLVISKEHELHAYLHWNQENGPTLFGFITPVERTIFLLIIDCSGVGPKLGVAILEQLGIDGFVSAITEGNERALSAVSGIGARKAEQVIVHLKHKVSKLVETGTLITMDVDSKQRQSLVAALTSLNYSRNEISNALQFLGTATPGLQAPFDQALRQALSFLAKRV